MLGRRAQVIYLYPPQHLGKLEGPWWNGLGSGESQRKRKGLQGGGDPWEATKWFWGDLDKEGLGRGKWNYFKTCNSL